jgi:hypothetical protein
MKFTATALIAATVLAEVPSWGKMGAIVTGGSGCKQGTVAHQKLSQGKWIEVLKDLLTLNIISNYKTIEKYRAQKIKSDKLPTTF